MTNEELIKYYPKLYHLTSQNAWEQIKKYGLMSTAAILDLYKIRGTERSEIETRSRRQNIALYDTMIGEIIIRDQKPLPESKVIKGLSGCSVSEWYKLLNSKVFLWAEFERFQGLLNARAYRNLVQLQITVNTTSLVEKYHKKIKLCRKNSGAMFNIHPIGPYIFEKISEYDLNISKFDNIRKPVVEVTIDYCIPDFKKYVLKVEEVSGGNILKVIYP